MINDVFIAGDGGQGILLIGNIIAEAALAEGREVTFLPSYGVEMRGGNANCTVVMSDLPVGSPAVTTPQAMITMSTKAFRLYEGKVLPDGLLIVNGSLVPASMMTRKDVILEAHPFNEMAAEMGNTRLANMIALGLYVGRTGAVKVESIEEGMAAALSERNRKFIPKNMEAIGKGLELCNNGK